MAKDKSTKKAVQAAPAPVNGIKSGRVTKPAEKASTKSKEVAKAAAQAVTKKSKKQPEPESSSESESASDATSESSNSSESESEPEAKPAPKAKAAKAAKTAKAPEPESDSSSSESESDDEVVKSADVEMKSGSDSDSSVEDEEDSEAEVPAANGAANSSESDSDSSSEDEEPAPKAVKKELKEELTKDSSDESGSDEEDDSSSDDDDEEEEKIPVKKEESAKKRKADIETSTPVKRVKMNGEPVGEPSKNLFVGSLSWNVDEDWLAREFDGFGEIAGVRIITRPEDGKSKGYGYVEFTNVEDATNALDAKQGAEIDGRNINVDFGKPRPDRSYNNEQVSARAQKFGDRAPSAPSNTLFVGNISFNATQDMVSEAFQEYGTVNGVRLPTDQETGVMKGFGYVEFGSVEEAQAAMEGLNGADIAGRNIRLDFAGQRSNDSGGFGSPRGGRGGRGGFGGRGGGGFGGRGGGRGGARGGRGAPRGGRGGFSSTNRGGFGDFQGKKTSF